MAFAVLLGIAVAALLAIWGDVPSVLAVLSRFPALLLVPAMLLTVWNYGLRWLKWQFYLRTLGMTGVTRWESLLVFLSGFAMSLTPGKAGEVSKSYFLRQIAGPVRAPFARTAPIVFAERLTDGIAMLLLATAGLAVFQVGNQALLLVGLVAVAALGTLQAPPLVHAAIGLLARIRLTRPIASHVQVAYDSARELLTWRRLFLAVGIGLLSWGGECVALYLILVGLGSPSGLDLLNLATFTLASASLVGAASLLPGGLGATEGAVASLLQVVGGQPREIAVAATLLIRAFTLWFGVTLGAVSLLVLFRRTLIERGDRP